MIFGDCALADAPGAVLAHTHRLPGGVLRKGAILDEASVALLRDAGRASVIVARLEPGDVGEDEAARRLAEALAGPGLTAGAAGTGRVNLHAGAAGLLRVTAPAIDAVNAVDEALTVATLADDAVVASGDMVATIKIIPFAVPEAVLARAEQAVRAAAPAMTLHPFHPLVAGLVLSTLPGLKESVIAGTIQATRARIAALGGTLLPPLICAHETAAIAAHLARLRADGATLLLVAGASATVDRRDVGPAAVVAIGGVIRHFGMPVDPGNLICLGTVGEHPALVLPGCARSPRPNGIDLVLQRLAAGLPVDGAAIAAMGVGGLLKEGGQRPLPRARATAAASPRPAAHPVAAIVLAAGRSSRMAPHHKLLVTDRAGKPMIARVVDNVLGSAARPVLVVVGHQRDQVRAALAGRPVIFVDADGYKQGLSASLRAGLAALPESAAAAVICLGDMPLVTGRVIDRLIAAWDSDEGRAIVQPTHAGRAGNPVLWDRRYFAEMRAIEGDSGARALLRRHADDIVDVAMDDDGVLRDFDTVESLATLPDRLRPPEAEARGLENSAARTIVEP